MGARGNTGDLDVQPFYRFIERTYGLHVVAMFAALYACGGLPALVWGGALRCAWVYHITWFVNSASHVWGYQSYNTGDQRYNPVLLPGRCLPSLHLHYLVVCALSVLVSFRSTMGSVD